MSEIILSINAGSSSVKISVYRTTTDNSQVPTQLAEAVIEGLTAPPAKLKYTRGDEKIQGKELENIQTQEDAFRYILKHLTDDEGLSELNHKDDIQFTCHRVVHGGDYPKSQIIDRETYHHIEELSDLAPLHNGPALTIVRAVADILPRAKNIAYFDSSFHNTIPDHICTYPIDQSIAQKNKLRKYGFHGISYSFIVHAVSTYLEKPKEELNIVALHLGSGASACCVMNGKSHDTSMGLTPLAGLPGATRSGSIDPSLMFHFTHKAGKPSRSSSEKLHITQAEEILNKNSGWKSLTGTTDFGKISSSDRREAQLAFDLFVDRISNYVAPYFTKLDGKVDALVFAGGIGEKGDRLRAAVVKSVQCLGFEIDEAENDKQMEGIVTDISKNGARYKTFVVQTDEQLEMARGVMADRDRFVGKK
ncbi:acetate kinase [Parastagonospora nodorum]|nr:acetate kinase [Parastagonospora nodorum]KAH3993426.1 acetate kinase [Parastagonospora nodorum]KAH4011775.1 acetate kinase [Parastagonospora nodorum]KAH4024813.1 acetate kinase [Parastagonospora nodorum]KAH4046112.1 acetate kinase [Parastagonospora nodorum]